MLELNRTRLSLQSALRERVIARHRSWGVAAALIFLTTAAATAETWRSTLVGVDWTPPHEETGFDFRTDKFIQDFSYAGYHRGERPLTQVEGPVFDVVESFGADPSGRCDATAAIQQAINEAAKAGGGVVWMPEGTYRLSVAEETDAALTITSPNVVLRGAGPTKTFLRNETFRMRAKSIIFVGENPQINWATEASTPLLLARDYPGPTRELSLEGVNGLHSGDWIVIHNPATAEFVNDIGMGPGADGLDWSQHLATLGGPRILRRIEFVDQDRRTISIDAPTRWSLLTRDGARIYKAPEHIDEVGLEGFSIGNRRHPGSEWEEADYRNPARAAYDVHASAAIRFRGVINSWVRDVSTYNPGNDNGTHLLSNGIEIHYSRGITLLRNTWQFSQYGGAGGNGYMIRLNAANECLVAETETGYTRHGLVVWHMGNSGNVFFRCFDHHTKVQRADTSPTATSGSGSDHHGFFSHSNLYDSTRLEASFLQAAYRGDWGSEGGHGMSASQVVYWNTEGISAHPDANHVVHSQQFGQGYVIGTRGENHNVTRFPNRADSAERTDPLDHLEGEGKGETLLPASLYLFQRARRLGAP